MDHKKIEWIHPAQDREEWLALMNTRMNLRIPRFFDKLSNY
jgi:hypothetical protein